MTMTCARCPTTLRPNLTERVEFFAYFNSNEESGVWLLMGKMDLIPPFMKVPSDEQKAKITELEHNIKVQESLLKSAE